MGGAFDFTKGFEALTAAFSGAEVRFGFTAAGKPAYKLTVGGDPIALVTADDLPPTSSRINWRADVVGQVYDQANPVLAGDMAPGDTVMVQANAAEICPIQFPAADLASIGKDITIINTIDKAGGDDNGTLRLTPFDGDNFMSWLDNQVLDWTTEDGSTPRQSRTFRSDGNGTWWCVAQGGMGVNDFSAFP